ncbi:MAG: hypothetical protein AAB890_02450 [Patescibacteria group bacterium]
MEFFPKKLSKIFLGILISIILSIIAAFSINILYRIHIKYAKAEIPSWWGDGGGSGGGGDGGDGCDDGGGGGDGGDGDGGGGDGCG